MNRIRQFAERKGTVRCRIAYIRAQRSFPGQRGPKGSAWLSHKALFQGWLPQNCLDHLSDGFLQPIALEIKARPNCVKNQFKRRWPSESLGLVSVRNSSAVGLRRALLAKNRLQILLSGQPNCRLYLNLLGGEICLYYVRWC